MCIDAQEAGLKELAGTWLHVMHAAVDGETYTVFMHLTRIDKRDIQYDEQNLSCFLDNGGNTHRQAAKNTPRYKRGTAILYLEYRRSNQDVVLQRYTDHGSNVDKRKTESGYCVYISSGGSKSKRRKVRYITTNCVQQTKTKHYAVNLQYVRQIVSSDEVAMNYIPTDKNCADILTTGLERIKTKIHTKELLGIREAGVLQ